MITPYCSVIIRLSSSMIGHLRETNDIFTRFFNECHQYHVAFTFAQMGSHFHINNLRSRLQNDSPPDALFSLGVGLPDQEQFPGRSTTSQVLLSDIFRFNDDGTYEDLIMKALFVFIDHLWKENYKDKLINVFSVPACVEWDLMDDVRLVRNDIIHNNSAISANTLKRLKILPKIWNIQEGKLIISSKMISSLFEQMNFTKVHLLSDRSQLL